MFNGLLYLENYLTPEIAIKTNHSKEAVDRYIKDYHRVETLWKHDITDLEQISHLSRLSKNVAQQYIDLLPEKLLKNHNAKLVDIENPINKLGKSGETEAGSAGEQPARDSRKQNE